MTLHGYENLPGKVLDVADVTVSFDGFKALNELNFSMVQGELRFVIGPNGAGKTTLLDVITGKTRPQRVRNSFRCAPISRPEAGEALSQGT